VDAFGRLAAPELMDDPARSPQELGATLRDLRWINRAFGAHAIVRAYLDEILPLWQGRRAPGVPLTLLDVATGGADVPQAVAEWGTRRGVPVRIVAVDRHSTTIRLARDTTSATPTIRVVRADARTLPFPDGAFDVCLCTLALHHLAPEEDLALLRRLHRLGRIGFLAVDLLRSRTAYAAVWLVTRFSRSPLIRHDGPLSVRRASSWEEYRRLAAASGIPGLRAVRLPLFRVALRWDA
jgi:hypothetical protein